MKLKTTLLALTVALYGCSDSSSSKAPTGPTTSSVSGAVTKGPVGGATVNVYSMDASGQPSGEAVAGPIITAEDGSWSADIPTGVARPLLVEAIGGAYTDEATGTQVSIGERKLSSFLPEGASTSSISPASEVVVRSTRLFLAANTQASIAEGVENGSRQLRESLGVTFDPLTVVPDPRGADRASREYAALLGGLSTLANNTLPGADPLDAVLALVDDASDGEIDGTLNGNTIAVNESESLPAITADNLVTAISEFTANEENGDYSDISSFTVRSEVTGNGAVTPTSVSVFNGTSVEFAISPAAGSRLQGTPQGCPGTLADNTFTTDALEAGCTLTVSFEQTPYTVGVAEVTGGTANPANQTVFFEATATISFTANTGYDLTAATGCGGVLEGSTYTTGPITADCIVTPVFELQQQTVAVNISPADSGSTDPQGPISVGYGEELAVLLIPNQGYAVSDAASTGPVASCAGTLVGETFTFTAVTSDCELNVGFNPIIYNVSASVTGPGSVTPVSADAVFGEAISLTLTPGAGAAIYEAAGCGGSLSGNVFTTAPVSASCVVSAEFRPLFTISAIAAENGSITPTTTTAIQGEAKSFDVTANSGYRISQVTGCGGSLSGNTYITGAVNADCTINASFEETDSNLPGAVWNQFNWDEASWQ